MTTGCRGLEVPASVTAHPDPIRFAVSDIATSDVGPRLQDATVELTSGGAMTSFRSIDPVSVPPPWHLEAPTAYYATLFTSSCTAPATK